MHPRDAGFALAARVLGAEALAQRCPRGSDGVQRLLGQDKAALAERVDRLRNDAGALLEGIEPSWIASQLLEAAQEVVDAVCRNLDRDALAVVIPELKRYGRNAARPGSKQSARRPLDARIVERFCQTAFAAFPTGQHNVQEPELKWLLEAPPREIETVAKECGLRSVARAFSRIGRDELAKLCHGLPPKDSVRLVTAVVELNERTDPDALRETQATHLRLLQVAGISPSLIGDTGVAFLASALVARLDDGARNALCYRLPEELGRRLRELSAPGALPERSACEAYQKEVKGWLEELRDKGIAPSLQ